MRAQRQRATPAYVTCRVMLSYNEYQRQNSALSRRADMFIDTHTRHTMMAPAASYMMSENKSVTGSRWRCRFVDGVLMAHKAFARVCSAASA